MTYYIVRAESEEKINTFSVITPYLKPSILHLSVV